MLALKNKLTIKIKFIFFVSVEFALKKTTMNVREVPDQYQGILKNMIDKSIPVLGDTTAGSAWVMKAMNPSAPITCVGMPDKTSSNIVMYNFEQTFMIEPPSTASVGDLWNYEINLHAHPIAMADVICATQTHPDLIHNSYTYLNSQLPDAPPIPAGELTNKFWTDKVKKSTHNYLYKTEQWKQMVQHARLCYAGITLSQTASSQSDQGMLLAGQQAQTPVSTVVADVVNGQFIKQNLYGSEDFGSFNNLSNLPRTYSGPSRDGCYQVMKLDEDFTHFKSQVTPVCTMSHTIGSTDATTGLVPSPHMFVSIENGTRGIELMDGYMPQIIIRGAASSTSFMCRLRMGFEVKPFAGASNTPFIMESPRYDVKALESYSQLIMELEQDGYPADYNLFEWLGGAIRKIAPTLGRVALGGLTGLATGGLRGAAQGAMGEGINALGEMIGGKRGRREVNFVQE